MTTVYETVVQDGDSVPVAGAKGYFYVGGVLAALTDDLGSPLSNPVTSDALGYVKATVPADNFTVKWHWLGRERRIDNFFEGASDSTLRADLAAVTGADLIGVSGGGTVQDALLQLGLAPQLGTAKTGVFFDTGAGDTFNGSKFSAASDAALTVNPTSLVFSSATAKDLQCFVKDSAGNLVQNCFDSFDVDATYTVTSFPSAGVEGVLTGMVRDNSGSNIRYGTMLGAGGAGAGYALAQIYNSDAPLATGTQFAFGAPINVRVRYSVRGTTVTATTTYPTGPDEVLNLAQVYTTSSFETPRLFSKLGLQFRQGAISCTALKVWAQYPNATYALVGDSLTQGKFASSHANSWGGKLRTAYPNEVIIAGASSATTATWLTATQTVIDMAPRYAFVCLGVNDILLARPLVDIQADYKTIMDRFTAAGITPIAISVPPINSSQVPTLNTWIAAQGWLYIDIYSALVGTGNALNAAYDSGDTVHWNNAGHTEVYDTITAAITSMGLTVPPNAYFVDNDPLMTADSDERLPTQAAVVDYVAAQRRGVSALGYGTGAGGTVTQSSSKSTGVTLNKLSGAVTMNNAALSGNTAVTFTLTNSQIAASDGVLVWIKSGATAASYIVSVDAVAAGSCSITLRNVTGGSLSEAVVVGFNVIKGAVS